MGEDSRLSDALFWFIKHRTIEAGYQLAYSGVDHNINDQLNVEEYTITTDSRDGCTEWINFSRSIEIALELFCFQFNITTTFEEL